MAKPKPTRRGRPCERKKRKVARERMGRLEAEWPDGKVRESGRPAGDVTEFIRVTTRDEEPPVQESERP